jgi:hypothetical protein
MKKLINYKKLIVNPENYRFEKVKNSSEAINLMLKEKGKEILNLAKNILDNGLDQTKDFRVLKSKNGDFIVLDGNRRITAIKCLHEPNLIKDEKLKKAFLKLLENKPKIIKEINSFIYGSEEEASKWIKLDHTGKNEGVGQDSWGTPEIERFGYKFEGKISPAMQIVGMIEEDLGLKVNTNKLKVTTINRILSNPESRAILGVDIQKGIVDVSTNRQEVVSNSKKLFDKVIQDNVKVDEVYSKEKSLSFMQELFNKKDAKNEKPILPSTAPLPIENNSKVKNKRSSPKTSSRSYLIPNSCVIPIDNTEAPKINNIYRELKNDLLIDDSLSAVPNAVGVLFRVFLEVSLDYYAKKNGAYYFKQNDTINIKINWVVTSMIGKGYDKKIFDNINKVGSSGKNQSYLSIDHFHAYVHSATVQPTPGELKAKWDNLQEFFITLWSSLAKVK